MGEGIVSISSGEGPTVKPNAPITIIAKTELPVGIEANPWVAAAQALACLRFM
jgi:hypothetical protein